MRETLRSTPWFVHVWYLFKKICLKKMFFFLFPNVWYFFCNLCLNVWYVFHVWFLLRDGDLFGNGF